VSLSTPFKTGFSAKEFPIWGVQFHPESYITENGLEILKNFIEL